VKTHSEANTDNDLASGSAQVVPLTLGRCICGLIR